MEYLRNKIVSSTRFETSPHENAEEKTITIHPGQVEEATHMITIPGRISLEELRFWAYVPDPHDYYDSQNDKIHNSSNETKAIENTEDQPKPNHHRKTKDSYLDIVIFEFPVDCSPSKSQPCDLPSYGIGAITDDDHLEGGIPHPHLSLCNETTGRLIIHDESFQGYHTTLHIPPSGYLMQDRITDPIAHRIPSFPSMDTQFEILFANCDTHAYEIGRNIELSGQILFEYDPSLSSGKSQDQGSTLLNNYKLFGGANDSPTHYHIGTNHQEEEYGENFLIDGMSQLKLLMVGLAVCVFFSLSACRIRRGTRSDYFMTRRNERERNANRSNSSNNDRNRYSDDDRVTDEEQP